MTISWFSRGIRDWRLPGIDWLCLRLDSGSPLTAVEFDEGTHHYFDEVFLLNTKAPAGDGSPSLVWHQTLSAPDPIGFTLSDLQELNADIILLRVRFCRPIRAPFIRGADSKEICCGHLWRENKTVEPIIMQIIESPQAGQAAPVPPRWRDAAGVLLAPAESATAPRLKKVEGGQAGASFQLTRPSSKDVQVLVLSGRDEVGPFAVDQMIDLTAVPDSIMRMSIPKGGYAPGGTVHPNAEAALALPLLKVSSARTQAGHALPLRQPIEGIRLSRVNDLMSVSWNWMAPPRWVTVLLEWQIVDDHNQVYIDARGKYSVYRREVTQARFKHRPTRELLRISDWPDWTIDLLATPHIQGEPLPEHALRVRQKI